MVGSNCASRVSSLPLLPLSSLVRVSSQGIPPPLAELFSRATRHVQTKGGRRYKRAVIWGSCQSFSSSALCPLRVSCHRLPSLSMLIDLNKPEIGEWKWRMTWMPRCRLDHRLSPFPLQGHALPQLEACRRGSRLFCSTRLSSRSWMCSEMRCHGKLFSC